MPDPHTEERFSFRRGQGDYLLLACGALAREIIDLIEINRWTALDVQCLPAIWHNTPQKIVPALRTAIRAARASYARIFVVYGDCGTGGLLDTMLAEEGVARIAGPHCYAFYAGNARFDTWADDDLTSFYLTDYLARHFDTLIWKGLGLDRHPELRDDYFQHYRRVVYLAQTQDAGLLQAAQAGADRLGLAFDYRFTGFGDLAKTLEGLATAEPMHQVL